MPAEPPSAAVVRIHRAMLDQLAELDRLGEHVCAAHLAAAVDALEDRLDGPRMDAVRDRTGDPVEAMAHALVERLGDRAAAAARRQIAGASSETLLAWAAIAGRIDGIRSRQAIGAS